MNGVQKRSALGWSLAVGASTLFLLSFLLLLTLGVSTAAVPAPSLSPLLLTEIVVTPTAGEFIEIHNPGSSVVDLSDVYLTDATFAPGGTFYYNIVTGMNAGGGGFGDFHARFPDGATIAPGEYQTISLPGSDDFFSEYGINPTYELFEDGGSPDAIPDMREAFSGSINGQGGLTNSGEVVILYHWDGSSDLVGDMDYFLWGDKDEAVDKTGVIIDGPDPGTGHSTYLTDTAIIDQAVVDNGGHSFGNSWQRFDPSEGAETKTGGNGVDGNDETSEDLFNTFCETDTLTPGASSACPTLITKEALRVVAPGELFTYTLTVENLSGSTLMGVVISDTVPANASYAYANDGGVLSGGNVVWNVGDIANLDTISVSFAVNATSSITDIINSSYSFTATNQLSPVTGEELVTTVGQDSRIHDIQSEAHISPLAGEGVLNVPGIVTVLDSGSDYDGFYMQDPNPDLSEASSEGIFVFTDGPPGVSVGDSVLVNGIVSEFRAVGFHPDFSVGPGAPNNLTITRVNDPVITVLSSGNSLPQPVVIGQGGRTPPTEIIDNDTTGNVEDGPTTFDPNQDGIDFYESLEGMLVQVNDAVVVGATRSFGDISVLGDNGVGATGTRTVHDGILAQESDFNPERIILTDDIGDTPEVNVGDVFTDPIVGVIDYSFGNYKLQPPSDLGDAGDGPFAPESSDIEPALGRLTIATFNVENLDPGDGSRFDALAAEIVDSLNSPDILALQEIQDNNGTTDDGTTDASETYDALIAAISAAGGPTYEWRDIAPEDNADGGAPGGNIRVGYLFNPSRVDFVDRGNAGPTDAISVAIGATGVELSASPGRIDPNNAAWDQVRKPLAAEFIFNDEKIFLVNNHWKSKSEDDPLFGKFQPPNLVTEPQRNDEATVVNDFVDAILALDVDANVVVLGDLNEFEFRPALQILAGDVLSNLWQTVDESERYSYVFDGNSQVLDHILVSENISNTGMTRFDVVHVNADRAELSQATDHDPLLVGLFIPEEIYLPIISKE